MGHLGGRFSAQQTSPRSRCVEASPTPSNLAPLMSECCMSAFVIFDCARSAPTSFAADNCAPDRFAKVSLAPVKSALNEFCAG